ncbi:hypothetical protein H257_13071 [Aphanomyces astaci]|uniref:PPM-type phosphatase domain-containing protein n=1 Tax=Aphanomyces astaci TaxID=112090 RepID=W4FVR7_APHAT|nr:hypothetical protein H257_13071 [Aphanomyces astaci]ETV71610.1 hypothetical protein H257_13071 [Aphanomyces astaci]|eukprot:XP_009838798.1 hypothetical protein H257_13071 [Aphanomyces astaci]
MKIAAVVAIFLVWTSCTEPSCFANGQSSTDEPIPLNFDAVERFVMASPVARVHRYDAASYAAKDPNEDRYVVRVDFDAVFASVLDGHRGWQVAEYVNQHLIDNAAALLGNVSSNNFAHIKSSLSRAFVATDDALRGRLLPTFQLGFGLVNRPGACTMLSYAKGDTLVVANAGDVRAVLASNNTSRGLVATPLSTDHNAKHASEQARLFKEHPNETDVVVCHSPDACYVKDGLQPTRGLGDFVYKYEEFNKFPLGPKYKGDGRFIPQPYTPPYILAVPEIQAVEIVADYVSRGEHELAAQALVNQVINTTAKNVNVDWNDIAYLKPGKERRRVHDDITVVVLFFQP